MAKRSRQVSLVDVMPKRKKGNDPSTEELLTGEDLEEDLCQEVKILVPVVLLWNLKHLLDERRKLLGSFS